ncbi:hypothetical protein E0Z10_g10744 [Xylaria hypoxylon]|uniref:BTB domain-containing protein n=1 Tax=Xylaria hypoxylon TaxID=37992 RepID=A0A4Z0YCH8_9PEZI|nr:hypothetical protein E0Z10_g10744 [Xylaria hypoxylon]
MSEQQEQQEQQEEQDQQNEVPVLSVSDGLDGNEDFHITGIGALHIGGTNELNPFLDVNEITEDSEEQDDDSRALLPSVPGATAMVPMLNTADPALPPYQSGYVDPTENHQSGDEYGFQQHNRNFSFAGTHAYGSMSLVAQVSEDDFKALNYGLFNYEAPRNQIMDSGRIVIAVVSGNAVLIHAKVLDCSEHLHEIFNNGSEEALMDRATFPNIGLPEFKILMLAIYGVKCPILGHQAYAGVDYIRALCLSNKFGCQPAVYDSVAECTRGHFNAFTNWMSIPTNGLTQDLHKKQIMEINDAFKAYKEHIRDDGQKAFMGISFAILLWEFCPAHIYCLYSARLDHELVRLISHAAFRKKEPTASFSPQESKLFTRPSL